MSSTDNEGEREKTTESMEVDEEATEQLAKGENEKEETTEEKSADEKDADEESDKKDTADNEAVNDKKEEEEETSEGASTVQAETENSGKQDNEDVEAALDSLQSSTEPQNEKTDVEKVENENSTEIAKQENGNENLVKSEVESADAKENFDETDIKGDEAQKQDSKDDIKVENTAATSPLLKRKNSSSDEEPEKKSVKQEKVEEPEAKPETTDVDMEKKEEEEKVEVPKSAEKAKAQPAKIATPSKLATPSPQTTPIKAQVQQQTKQLPQITPIKKIVQIQSKQTPGGTPTTLTTLKQTNQAGKPVKIYSLQQMKVQQQQQQGTANVKQFIVSTGNASPQQQSLVQKSPVKIATTNMGKVAAGASKSNDSLLINKNEPATATPNATAPQTAVPQTQTATPKKAIDEEDSKWHTVGIYTGLNASVNSFIDNSVWSSAGQDFTSDTLPDLSKFKRTHLEPGTAYRFRMRAINTVGASEWSEVSSFKTCLPGFPGAPSAIKISKSSEGAHLTWEPPPTCRDTNEIIEYSVYLAIKPGRDLKDGKSAPTSGGRIPAQLAFVRVYVGPANQCTVPHSSLVTAHVDCTTKPAIIFRIAARNEKGYGPATQVRWLQDANLAPATSATNSGNNNIVAPRLKKIMK